MSPWARYRHSCLSRFIPSQDGAGRRAGHLPPSTRSHPYPCLTPVPTSHLHHRYDLIPSLEALTDLVRRITGEQVAAQHYAAAQAAQVRPFPARCVLRWFL